LCMRLLQPALAFVLCATALLAQKPEFEVASIRPSDPQSGGRSTGGMRMDGAQVRFTFQTLKDYIGIAYRVRVYQIAGPDWLTADRFDISATLPAGSNSQIGEMLQALLADRFQLKFHREKRDFPVYALVQARGGAKMEPVALDPAPEANAPVAAAGTGSAQGIAVNLGRGTSYTFSNNRFEATKLGMPAFAVNLERFVDRPIVDRTELTGNYNFSLDVTEEDYRAMLLHTAVSAGAVLPQQALQMMEAASLGSLFSALEKIGLKLDARKEPLEFLVVDEARKAPPAN
jgi:uncharacterized protein (TIGR03435 family)